MFTLFSIYSGLEVSSVNHASIKEKSDLKVFKKITFSGEIPNNLPNNLLGSNLYKSLES